MMNIAGRNSMVEYKEIVMAERKRIALISHDAKKRELLEWVEFNKELLSRHTLYGTGTTGAMIEELGLEITKLQSGMYGGDQQVGALIADGGLDMVIFFLDPLDVMPHQTDISALLRLCAVWNIPVACNRATGDFLVSSPLIKHDYVRIVTAQPTIEERMEEIG
jgi:methylglyoxal synthase